MSKEMKPKLSQEEADQLPWQKVGKVSFVWVYPVKSCAPLDVSEAYTDPHCLTSSNIRDRCLMLASPKGNMITGRMVGSTVLIKPQVDGDNLTLSFPEKDPLHIDLKSVIQHRTIFNTEVWGEKVTGLDCGDEAAQWLNSVLKRDARLLYHADIPSPRVTKDPEGKWPLLRDDDNSMYADLTAYMLMTQSSLDDLQSRVNVSISPKDFRPNIFVEGTLAYEEDNWEYIKFGGAIFRNVKPCDRCIFTTIRHETGKKDPNMEPLRTLRGYRCEPGNTSPEFGINLGVDIPGTIKAGDDVYVTYKA
ncbi:unnamed protein product [Meganyctiphanes norvegica]|uniref:MOSC domain-containing protein n=1 Tax=Meganyctiphanes norvegica TaxID=48144 RepID=A0AAV2QCP8_MEGNR